MLVKDLIKVLQTYDIDLPVYQYVDEYEAYHEKYNNVKIKYIIKSIKNMEISEYEYNMILIKEKKLPYCRSQPNLYTKGYLYEREYVSSFDKWIYTIPESLDVDDYEKLPQDIKDKYIKSILL